MRLSWSLVWRYIEKHGPQAPRHIAEVMGCHPESARKALVKLAEAGKLYKTGGATWHVRYGVVPGCIPPACMKGHAPGSLRNLAIANEKKRRRPRTFGECALAQCWKVSELLNSAGD